MPTLHLIDGSSYLFRAFHALPPLTNAEGEATGALFGVVNMLRRWQNDEKPEYAAFVFDASGPTFRDEMYADYKANRPPTPVDLKAQIPPLLELVGAMGLTVIRVSGVEADDVIGTLAVQAKTVGFNVVISTSDKDLTQLVDDQVLWVNTMSNERLDAKGVTTKFGVPPALIIDYLALKGDSADNIPGVNGVGDKTACKWLTEYGSLDGVVANADKVGGKIGEKLRAALDQLPLYRQLATVKLDCVLDVGPNDLKIGAPDNVKLVPLFQRYGFNQALRELGISSSGETLPAPISDALKQAEKDYDCLRDAEALAAWVKRLEQTTIFALDLETTSLDPLQAEIVGIAVADAPGKAAYIPVAHTDPEPQLSLESVLDALRPLIEGQHPKVLQHGKYDREVLQRAGVTLRGQRHDTMLQSYVLNSTAVNHNMDAMAKKYLSYTTVAYSDVAGKGAKQIGFADVPIADAAGYAAEDADITLRLHLALWPRLEALDGPKAIYRDLEMPLIAVLQRMEERGILIDSAELARQSAALGSEMMRTVQKAHELAGHVFSLDSPKQLATILFEQLGLTAKIKTPGGAPSTNEEALEYLADDHELPAVVLHYRGLAKLKSTYTDKLPAQVNPQTGRVHTSFHQAVAATGRLSSSDPNLQNIPIRTAEGRQIRQAFIAKPGYQLLAADYSQIELRIMAHLSADPGLCGAFANGLDVHAATAAEVFGVERDAVSKDQRRAAKVINFGLIYGMGAFGLARNLSIPRNEAAAYIKRYFERYPGVQRYMADTKLSAKRQGYVETIFGRRLYLPDINSRAGGIAAGAERAAINAPMQGSAADIIKRAMLSIHDWLGDDPDCQLLLQVHDELVFEVRAERIDDYRNGIRSRMESAATLDVPLLVDIGVGANWDQAH